MKYTIKRTNVAPAMDFAWDGACWKDAETAELTNLRPEGSGHRPVVKVPVSTKFKIVTFWRKRKASRLPSAKIPAWNSSSNRPSGQAISIWR